MREAVIKMEILSPEATLFNGEVKSATFPGMKGKFTVLKNHAPIISVLDKGEISWIEADGEHTLEITDGFVEVKNNKIIVCIDSEQN